ncbi:MAG: phosphopantetheine-binding protein [Verrucomicrobia bacterium]|nr:phosphopantetheine-binding protein [Verrucomicrobiota bacterium]
MHKIYYLTGDLGEIAPDGCIYHRGRTDFQVKIRGNRVDLLEVEAALLEVDGISQVAAVAHTNDHFQVNIVAYIEGELTDSQVIREKLQSCVPIHMIPSQFVFMESLPRTLSGKIDRRSLPPPDIGPSRKTDSKKDLPDYSDVQEQIFRIWKDVLNVGQIGLHDHFVEFGGDSLKAMIILARLNRRFGIQLSLRSLFDFGTVSQTAEVIQTLLQADNKSCSSEAQL